MSKGKKDVQISAPSGGSARHYAGIEETTFVMIVNEYEMTQYIYMKRQLCKITLYCP